MSDVSTCGAVISACGKGEMALKALQLFEQILLQGLQPDVFAYSTAISACGKGRMAIKSMLLLKELRQQGLQPDVITCNAASVHAERLGWQ